MNPLALIPYALAAYGGYQGYRSARDSGAGGLGQLLGGATGAYTGYSLGQMVPGVPQPQAAFQLPKGPGRNPMAQYGTQAASQVPVASSAAELAKAQTADRSITDILFRKKDPTEGYDPLKISALAGGIPLALGAFNQGPVDVYQPTYNLAYGEFASQRPNYKYIDPSTGQEKDYEKVYIPEADPANRGDMRMGPYAMTKTR